MTIRPIFSPSARVKERSPLRVGFAAGAGPILSARVFSDSRGGTEAATNDLGKTGIGSRGGATFTDSGNRPSEGIRGVSTRTAPGVEAGAAVAAGAGAAGADARVGGFAFVLAAEFVTPPVLPAGP